MLGYHVHILGWAEILEPHGETSLAEIKESAIDIVKGDRLMARKPRVREITIQSSPEGVEGQISFLAEQRRLVAMMEYVYLNRGTLDGLEVGSPLEVYRKGYTVPEEVRGTRLSPRPPSPWSGIPKRSWPSATTSGARSASPHSSLRDLARTAGLLARWADSS
jgi:hypothetical protein